MDFFLLNLITLVFCTIFFCIACNLLLLSWEQPSGLLKKNEKKTYISLHFQILHISEADVLETKMFGSSPLIILRVSTLAVISFFLLF